MKSNTLRSAAPSAFAKILIARLAPPVAMARIRSMAANNPLKVRFNLSALTSLRIRDDVNL